MPIVALQFQPMVDFRSTSDASLGKSLLTDSDEFVFVIEEVPRKLRRLFDASMARFGLTRTQWRALVYIYRTPGITQTDLAKCSNWSVPADRKSTRLNSSH